METAGAATGGKGQGIVDHLAAAIRDGRYAPGQRLVEAELTAEFGVSRGPVREALRRLAAEGLVEIVPHRGALVRRLSLTEALELFEIRTELEALAARRAAARMGEACVRERFQRDTAPIWREAARYSTADYLAENRGFHAAIYAAAGNSQLARVNRQLQLALILSQISPALTAETIAASLAEHRAIARAIAAGDAAAAEAASRAHMDRASRLLRAVPAALFRKERPAEMLRATAG
ncbi:MAG: GntR family transcriptional regulator [Alphaproteobacteria bacterium]|nr:MAG: GntR family transcriptional regulator [Alphaproteobacteria bacterium]